MTKFPLHSNVFQNWRKTCEEWNYRWPINAHVVQHSPDGKKEILCVPLDFQNSLTIDGPVASRAYVSEIAQNGLDRIKQRAATNTFQLDVLPAFQLQVASARLEEPFTTVTLKFDIRDRTSTEQIVIRTELTGPIIALHFMRHKSVVIDTTHGVIHFPYWRRKSKMLRLK